MPLITRLKWMNRQNELMDKQQMTLSPPIQNPVERGFFMYSHKDETKWNMYYMNIYMIWRKWTKKFKILTNAIKWKVIKYEKKISPFMILAS